MVLKRFTGLLNRRSDDEPGADADTPEANATRGVKLFCESGGPNSSSEEIQYLPDIVTAAESSPPAAAACAYQIRKFLSKDNYSKPYLQYNAIMLIRILSDNPGPTFTRNMNEKFITVVKELLRQGKDPSVQQILRETLYSLERDKAYDTNLIPLFTMWRNEQVFTSHRRRGEGSSPSARVLNAPPWANDPTQQGAPMLPVHPSRSKSLPSPDELAGRIEEAKTSAKLLIQLIQSTQQSELTKNDLVQEFGERCQQAQRSIQGYINAENPAPDDDTMLTLIETNEQLSLAISKHQRAMLGARRTASSNNVNEATESAPAASTRPLVDYTTNSSSSNSPVAPASFAPPSDPPKQVQSSFANRESPPSTTAHVPYDSGRQSSDSYCISDDPFADPNEPQHYGNHVTTQADPRNAYGAMGEATTNSGATQSHPGYNSTPSYLARQESSGANHTMHGAFSPVEEGTGTNFSGVSALGPDDYERGATYNSGAGMDVSPVEERRVVYRY